MRRHVAVIADASGQAVESPHAVTAYMHGDLIRSAVMTSNDGGYPTGLTAYTAFGELVGEGGVGVPPANPADAGRYGYAGGWGYESPAGSDPRDGAGAIVLAGANGDLPPITLLHVGARWYQPGIGRFVQRDPIGLGGGVNCYAYCEAGPGASLDGGVEMSIVAPGGGGRFRLQRILEEMERRIPLLIEKIGKTPVGRQVAYRNLLKLYQAMRNAIYGAFDGPLGPICVMVAAPVIGGYAGAAAGRAASPYVDRAADAYRDWTFGGRGGFRPGELWN